MAWSDTEEGRRSSGSRHRSSGPGEGPLGFVQFLVRKWLSTPFYGQILVPSEPTFEPIPVHDADPELMARKKPVGDLLELEGFGLVTYYSAGTIGPGIVLGRLHLAASFETVAVLAVSSMGALCEVALSLVSITSSGDILATGSAVRPGCPPCLVYGP